MYILELVGNMHIEILLKQVREEKCLTLSQLSTKTGISKTHINDVENNLKGPSLLVMVKLAKALDVKITDLYTVIW